MISGDESRGARLSELLDDREFFRQLTEAGSLEQIRGLFLAKGLAVSAEELDRILCRIQSAIRISVKEELEPEDLENVVGGAPDSLVAGIRMMPGKRSLR